MVEAPQDAEKGRGALARILIAFAAVAGALLAAGFLLLALLNTDPGRDLLVRQLARIAPESGLTVSVGRIEGSLFSRLTIRDLALGDPSGTFLTAPTVALDWRPSQLPRGILRINELTAPEVRWLRRPKLRKTERTGPILPDIDIFIGRLRLERVILEPPVVGRHHVARLDGRADIRSGRALINATALVLDGGDRIDLKLDAEPDRDRFDLDATVQAPVGGVLTTLSGLGKAFDLRVRGDGSWSRWRGTATGAVGGRSLVDLAVSGDNGRFTLGGTAAPGLVVGGLVQRLTAPAVRLDAAIVFAARRGTTTFALSSPQLRLNGQGVIDLAEGVFDGFTANIAVLRPEALLRRAAGRNVRLALKLDGAFARPTIDYAFSADQLALATTVLERFRVSGRATVGTPLVIPATATVARVTGVGPFVGGLLTNVRVVGPITAKDLVLTSNALVLRSDRVNGRAVARFDLRTGRYDVAILGKLPRYLVPGIGLVDVDADLKVVPSADGRNPHLRGGIVARVVRLDNAFFRTLLEGNPTLRATLDIPPDGHVYFSNARLTSPGLTLTGSGNSSRDGTYRINAVGQSRLYGPVAMQLVGPLAAPNIALRLMRPGMGVGLADVDARLTPTPEGFAVTAVGATSYGRARLAGRIVTRAGPAALDIAALEVAGLTAHGRLTQSSGAFAGTLTVSGPGIGGTLRFSPERGVQRVDAALTADNARLALATPVSIVRGTLGTTALLFPNAPTITGRAQVAGLSRGGLDIESGDVAVEYRAGRGTATGSLRGRQGVPFTADGSVRFEPNRIAINGKGTVERRAVTLRTPAELTRVAGGWRLAPVGIGLPEGGATVSGTFAKDWALSARLDGVGLELLDLFWPDLDLGGRASGTVDVTLPGGNALPRARVNVRVARLTRTGLATVSLPVDLALTAAMEGNAAAARAVIQRRGVIIGRAQAQLRPIPGGVNIPLLERLYAAPLFAQVRFNGPAGALWPLTGIEAFDVRGPLAIAGDFGGRLGDPTIRGTIRSQNARLESTVLGTVVENIRLDGRFDGSRLDLGSFSGTAGGGTISGSGAIDVSPERGFPIDLRLQLAKAEILRRDDLRATATGPLTIRSGRDGGLVSGNLKIDKARFSIGRPATETVPELTVRERSTALVRRGPPPRKPTIWRLDIKADADNNVDVRGMGLDSEWEATLRLGGRADMPEITGTAELLRGSYEFAGRRFEITRGTLRFTGGYPPDPIVDIAAEARVEGLTANIRISGTAFRPEIAFGSTPALPEDEVLSRVLFGTSITNLSAPEALQLAGAVASLRGGGGGNLDVLNVLRKGIGVDRLRILPGDTTRGTRDGQRRGTTVAAGEYIGDRVYVELASDAQGYTATQLEVRLTRSLSILSQVATVGGTSVNLRWSKDY